MQKEKRKVQTVLVIFHFQNSNQNKLFLLFKLLFCFVIFIAFFISFFVPLRAKPVGEFIEIRHKKISPTRTLSTL